MARRMYVVFQRTSDGTEWRPLEAALKKDAYPYHGFRQRDYEWLHEAKSDQALIESFPALNHGAMYRVFSFADGETFEVSRSLSADPPPAVVTRRDA